MGWQDGWESVGWARAWDLYAGLVFGGCMRACVRSFVLSYAHVSSVWAGLGREDGLRIWAEQVEGLGHDRIGQADKPSLGGSVGFRLAERYSTYFSARKCKSRG